VTVRNLKVIRVDADNNLLLVEGAVPGGPNAIVVIRKAIAAKPIRGLQQTIDDAIRFNFLKQPLTQAEINSLIDLSYLQ